MPDPTPWLHENGTRYDHCDHAPPGALFGMPRPEYTTEKEKDR